MKEIIRKIFDKEYKKNEKTNEDIVFYEKENQEYFLVSEYSETEILKFFESEKTNNLINFFDELKKEKSDIQKNTSLIIFLKVNNLKEDLEKLKNQIFKIEEDEYFFRKYVIVYTDKSIKNLQDFDFSEDEISREIKEEEKFQSFQDDNLFDDEYFFLIQLLVKLPFLRFKTKSESFESISNLIKNSEGIEGSLKTEILNSSVNFDDLEKELLSEEKKEIDFLQTFKKYTDEN